MSEWLTILPEITVSIVLLSALLLDKGLGEPKRFHHLIGFGRLANLIEAWFNKHHKAGEQQTFSLNTAAIGTLCWLVLVIPVPFVYIYLHGYFTNSLSMLILDVIILYLAIGQKSLQQHANQVYQPLKNNDVEQARHFTGYLVSRDTSQLTESEMARATAESMLENGNDAVITSLVCYVIGGAPLVILHRLANTLDAMWGYKNARFNSFGYAAAKLDDLLAFIPAKVCTLLYALQGAFWASLKNAYRQGNQYKSHNGGWVMAAGATALGYKLGGTAFYHGKQHNSPTLGQGKAIDIAAIPRSVNLVKRATSLLILFTFIGQLTFMLLAK
ncbi:cobalamin biosynthesis protein CobD [Saccharobesus litoralis]|uniref:Cobalamin biosynthesis protein CobD n=1 Tax=Saccharobesus litoralis TaxID=2172099 RepID=A0A2S0VLV3_9ALTE|nr:adenosylcobinamide-phosphate synthase CbiB [Saccharobesus litoralis]AWB65196.1 cobalamin biosynthesis protein CobD [Saccharobesus litoralis]